MNERFDGQKELNAKVNDREIVLDSTQSLLQEEEACCSVDFVNTRDGFEMHI